MLTCASDPLLKLQKSHVDIYHGVLMSLCTSVIVFQCLNISVKSHLEKVKSLMTVIFGHSRKLKIDGVTEYKFRKYQF